MWLPAGKRTSSGAHCFLPKSHKSNKSIERVSLLASPSIIYLLLPKSNEGLHMSDQGWPKSNESNNDSNKGSWWLPKGDYKTHWIAVLVLLLPCQASMQSLNLTHHWFRLT